MRRGRAVLGASLAATLLVMVACGSSQGEGTKIDPLTPDASGDGASAGGSGNGTGGADGGNLFGSDDGGSITEKDASCGHTKVDAAPRPANVLLVVDKSGSMTGKPTGFDSDKWTALADALSGAIEKTPDVSYGLELYPYPADPTKPMANACEMPAAPGVQVPIAANATSVPKIKAALTDTTPEGGTPTAAALSRALTYFKTGAGSKLTGDKYVLLATDGGPDCNPDPKFTCEASGCTTNLDGKCPIANGGNCCDASFGADIGTHCLDDKSTRDQIAALLQIGVKTFVVGIPGTEAYQTALDSFAEASGEVNPSAPPKYFAVQASGGVQGLADVLTSITKGLITTCNLQLDSTPPALDKLNVEVDSEIVPKGQDGWELDATTTPPTIKLVGATCDRVKTEGVETVSVVYGCKTVIR